MERFKAIRIRLLLATFILSLWVGGNAFACPPDPWTIKTPLPNAQYGAGVASDGNYLYAVGGYAGTDYSSQLLRYDPLSDSWALRSPLPTPLAYALIVFAEGKLFVFGGENSAGILASTQIYNIANNTWSSGTSMPGTRQQSAGGYFNGKIYVVGGYETTSISAVRNQTWEYTIGSNSWSAKTNLPASLGGAGAGIVNGHLYVCGGRNATLTALNTTYDYDIAGNSWSTRNPLPTAVNYPGSAVYRGKIWIFGGGAPFTGLANTQIFDPAANTWTAGPPLNVGRSFQGGAVVGNRIFSVGGYTTGASNAVEASAQPLLRVLIVYADAHIVPRSLQARLLMLPGVGQADIFDAQSSTPSLAQLQAYDVVVPFSNSLYSNPAALGDALADYLDGGGVVVGFTFDWGATGNALAGRWLTGGYTPFTAPGTSQFSNGTLGSYSIGHPLMEGVTSLNAYYRQNLTLAPGAVQIAAWNDGSPLLAYKGRAVGLSAYIGDYSGRWSGDFAQVIVNAGYWLRAGNVPCPALACPGPTVIHGALTAGDPVQTGRLTRSDPPGSCAAPTICPGTSGTTPLSYDVYPFLNNTRDSQCITVNLDAGSCTGTGNWIQSAAYLGNYNPADLCSGFLADIGASPNPTQAYSFTVPAGLVYRVVVNKVDAGECPAYTLSVSSGDCPPSPVTRTNLPFIINTSP